MKEIIDHIKAILGAKAKTIRLELIEDGAKLSTNLIFSFLLVLGLFFLTLLFSVVVLISLSVYLESYVIGSIISFLIFTLILGCCYLFFKPKIKSSMTSKVYQKLVDEQVDSEIKFEAIKQIEELKAAYHEKEALEQIEALLINVENSANVIASISNILKTIKE